MHSRSKFQRQSAAAPTQAPSLAISPDSLASAAEASAHAAARTATMRQLIARSVLHGPTLRSLLAPDR